METRISLLSKEIRQHLGVRYTKAQRMTFSLSPVIANSSVAQGWSRQNAGCCITEGTGCLGEGDQAVPVRTPEPLAKVRKQEVDAHSQLLDRPYLSNLFK